MGLMTGGSNAQTGNKKPLLGGSKDDVWEDIVQVRYVGGSARLSTNPKLQGRTNVFIDLVCVSSQSGAHEVGGSYGTITTLGGAYPDMQLADLKGKIYAGLAAQHAAFNSKGLTSEQIRETAQCMGAGVAEVMALEKITPESVDSLTWEGCPTDAQGNPDPWDAIGEECLNSATFPLQDALVQVHITSNKKGYPNLVFSAP